MVESIPSAELQSEACLRVVSEVACRSKLYFLFWVIRVDQLRLSLRVAECQGYRRLADSERGEMR